MRLEEHWPHVPGHSHERRSPVGPSECYTSRDPPPGMAAAGSEGSSQKLSFPQPETKQGTDCEQTERKTPPQQPQWQIPQGSKHGRVCPDKLPFILLLSNAETFRRHPTLVRDGLGISGITSKFKIRQQEPVTGQGHSISSPTQASLEPRPLKLLPLR